MTSCSNHPSPRMDDDPIPQSFAGQDSVDLYGVLEIQEAATLNDIKRAYQQLALFHYPDKHAAALDTAKLAWFSMAYIYFSLQSRR